MSMHVSEPEMLMKQGVDSKALFALYMKKLPMIIILAVAGAVLGSGLNLIIALLDSRDAKYVSETEYYIEFAEGRYEARDYYNDFTWNDVITTQKLIIDRVMEIIGTGYDKNKVINMVKADILSDVRYLTITIKGDNIQDVENVKNAMVTALEEFGSKMNEFERIYIIDDLDIVKEKTQYFVWRAALLGAVIFVLIEIFIIAFGFCMGSSFYTKNDVSQMLGIPVYGMTFSDNKTSKNRIISRQDKMLTDNIKMFMNKYSEIHLLDASDGEYSENLLEKMRNKTDITGIDIYNTDTNVMQTGTKVVVVIPFGINYKEKITDEINNARLHEAETVGAVLVNVDRHWAEIYYR